MKWCESTDKSQSCWTNFHCKFLAYKQFSLQLFSFPEFEIFLGILNFSGIFLSKKELKMYYILIWYSNFNSSQGSNVSETCLWFYLEDWNIEENFKFTALNPFVIRKTKLIQTWMFLARCSSALSSSNLMSWLVSYKLYEKLSLIKSARKNYAMMRDAGWRNRKTAKRVWLDDCEVAETRVGLTLFTLTSFTSQIVEKPTSETCSDIHYFTFVFIRRKKV